MDLDLESMLFSSMEQNNAFWAHHNTLMVEINLGTVKISGKFAISARIYNQF